MKILYRIAVTVCVIALACNFLSFKVAADTIFDKTVTVDRDGWHRFSFDLDKGDYLTVHIKTDGGYVAYFLMNPADFTTYKNAYDKRHVATPIKMTSFQNEYDIRDKTFHFSAPYDGRYMVVIDNSQIPKYGENTDRAVNVHVNIRYEPYTGPADSELPYGQEPGIYFDPNKIRHPEGLLKDPSKIWGGGSPF